MLRNRPLIELNVRDPVAPSSIRAFEQIPLENLLSGFVADAGGLPTGLDVSHALNESIPVEKIKARACAQVLEQKTQTGPQETPFDGLTLL